MIRSAAILCLFHALLALLLLNAVEAVRRLPNDQRSAAEEVLDSIMDPQQTRRRLRVEVPVPKSPDEHLVTDLPLLKNGTLPTAHWAGLLPASQNNDKYLFYWLFAPDLSAYDKVKEEDIPLIVWLNGGPGCSSMDGLFLENGPLRFVADDNGNFQMVAAEHSWHKTPAYMLYVDQPVGTGLSFTTSHKYPKNDLEVNQDFYTFLQSFLALHSDKFVNEETNKMHRPFYFTGESHAGHYIPSMMAHIIDQNKQVTSGDGNKAIYIPQSGAGIGNGWIDPFHQYAAAEAAYGKGIIGSAQRNALDAQEKQCQAKLNNGDYASGTCFQLLDLVVGQSYGSKSLYKVSQYDVRHIESRRGSRTFPPGHKTVEAYLGGIGLGSPNGKNMDKKTMNQALQAIHATPSRTAGQVYQECTDPPYDALADQDGLGVVPEVVKVLEHESKIRLLFFNGMEDLICNHVGNEILLEKLPWKHNQDYINAPRAAWKSKAKSDDENKISGYIKEFQNLLFLKVMDSGHMVPMDLPEVSLDMMRTFVYGGEGAFQFSPQKLNCNGKGNDECVCPSNNELLEKLNALEKKLEEGAEDEGNGRL